MLNCRHSTAIAIEFTAAAKRPENRLEDGSPNWDYIDADIWIIATAAVEAYNKAQGPMGYVKLFDYLAEALEEQEAA